MSEAPCLCTLVVATIGREAELERLFTSIAAQSERDFEVIVVDQNADERVAPLIARLAAGGVAVRHLRQQEPNLASARNLAIAHARGAWLAFPDDDCWYEPDTLAALRRSIAPRVDGYVGTWVEMDDPLARRAPLLDLMHWRKLRGEGAASICLFLSRALLRRLGGFDPRLGVGQWYGAGEETDLTMRALETGARLKYAPAIVVHHEAPEGLPPLSRAALAAQRARARGAGAFYAKHGLSLWRWLRAVAGAPLRLTVTEPPAGLLYGIAISLGRFEGYLRWRLREEVFGRGGVAMAMHTLSAYRMGTMRRLGAALGGLRVFVAGGTPAATRLRLRDVSPITITGYASIASRRLLAGGGRSTSDWPLGLAGLLRRLRPEVLVTVELGPRTAIGALARRLGWVRRLVVHGDIGEFGEVQVGAGKRALRRLLLGAADAVVVNGASGERYLRALAPTLRAPIHHVPYASEAAFLTAGARRLAAGTPADGARPAPDNARVAAARRRLVFVGQFVAGKGVEPFLRALREVLDADPALPPVSVTLLGAGPLEGALRALAAELADAARSPGQAAPAGDPPRHDAVPRLEITVGGPVAHAKLPERLAAHDALFLASEAETWGMVVNEALACALPVLGSVRAQAVEELVVEGRSGWLFDPADAGTMRAAIRRALRASPLRLRRMGRLAHASAARVDEAHVCEAWLRAIGRAGAIGATGTPLADPAARAAPARVERDEQPAGFAAPAVREGAK